MPDCDRDIFVLKATEDQLRKWKNLEGKICWKHVNDFDAPCSWCPVLKAMASGQIESSMAVSPKNVSEYGESDVCFNECSPCMEYANLVAVPLGRDDKGIEYALEISVDKNKEAKEARDRRTKREKWAAAISDFVVSAADDEFAEELILFGASATSCLGYNEVDLVVLETGSSSCDYAFASAVVSYSSLKACHLASAEETFTRLIEDSRRDSSLRTDLALLAVREKLDPEDLSLYSTMMKRRFDYNLLVEQPWATPIAIRTSCTTAAVCISQGRKTAHSILLVRCASGCLISEDDLTDLTMYGLFISQSLSTRHDRYLSETESQHLKERASLLDKDTEALALTAGMIVGFAHDLKRTYGSLMHWSGTILDFLPPKKAYKAVRTDFERDLEFGKKLLSRLSTTSHIAHPEPEEFSLVEETKRFVAEEKTILEKSKISLEMNLRPADLEIRVKWDRVMYGMVLFNLIDNAQYWLTKTRKRPAKILVRLAEDAERPASVRIEVLDNGPGIPPEHDQNIFKPFFSLRRGMGIGLNAVRRIVEFHGGTITQFRAGEWSGACFRIVMPIEAQTPTP